MSKNTGVSGAQKATSVLLVVGGIYNVVMCSKYHKDSFPDVFDSTSLPKMIALVESASAILIVVGLVGVFRIKLISQITNPVFKGLVCVTANLLIIASIMSWSSFSQAKNAQSNYRMLDSMGIQSANNSQSTDLFKVTKYVCDSILPFTCNLEDIPNAVSALLPLKKKYYVPPDGWAHYTNATKDVQLSVTPNVNGFQAVCSDVQAQVAAFGPAEELAAQYKYACRVCAETPVISHLPSWMYDFTTASGIQSCMNWFYGAEYRQVDYLQQLNGLLQKWSDFAIYVAPSCSFLSFMSIFLFYSIDCKNSLKGSAEAYNPAP